MLVLCIMVLQNICANWKCVQKPCYTKVSSKVRGTTKKPCYLKNRTNWNRVNRGLDVGELTIPMYQLYHILGISWVVVGWYVMRGYWTTYGLVLKVLDNAMQAYRWPQLSSDIKRVDSCQNSRQIWCTCHWRLGGEVIVNILWNRGRREKCSYFLHYKLWWEKPFFPQVKQVKKNAYQLTL